MLPPDFVRARRRKGTIRLQYASKDDLSLTKTLVSVHKEHIDRTRGELKKALKGCEELGFDYKLVRGLTAVLEERCVFRSRAVIDPLEVRRAVFEEAAGNVIVSIEDRTRVLSTVAFRMNVSISDLDQSLYADLQDELVLSAFTTIPPLDLLKEYNFALTLALLAHASRLELTYKGRDERTVELSDKLGRKSIQRTGATTKIVVEWRQTKRIGYKAMHLEALLTRLLTKKSWVLTADIRFPLKSRKNYRFEISYLDGKMIKPSTRVQEYRVKPRSNFELLTLPKGEIIDISEMAMRLGVTEDEVRKRFKQEGGGYVERGGILFKKEKLDEVEKALANACDMQLGTVRGILRDLGCRNPLPVLEALGYAIEWSRERDKSTVYRLRRNQNAP